MALAQKLDAKLLPVYILDENITKKPAFEQFKSAFSKNWNYYILSEGVAAPSFYAERESIPDKLDLFVIENDPTSAKAEQNLKEFLDATPEINYDKHFSGSQLAKELGIKNFPAFLVNNRVKFSGVQAAETIRNYFCRLNNASSCSKQLSKSLV